MNFVTATIISCWIILFGYWTVSAFFQKPVSEKANFFSKLTQAILMLIPVILLIKYDFFYFFTIVIVKVSTLVNILSVIICLLGLFTAIWARTILGRNWSARVVFKKNHELIQNGPYKFVRHPIYTGFLLLFLGTALAIGRIGPFVGLVILFIGLWIKLRQEEALMLKHFGKKYLDYKKRTKALIPFLL
jgi:protein-S-isoprenylcysteine O-methyltransferase Ste14